MRIMCGVQLKGWQAAKNLMLMLNLNEATYQLAMVNSMHWHILEGEWSCLWNSIRS